jgi:predicted Zn-dependent protease with MMP-like domain
VFAPRQQQLGCSVVVMARGSRRQDSPRRRNRDRHGRGLRGPLYPATLPAARSRAERFDALVIEALEPIEARWRTELTQLDVAVDDVPDVQVEGEDGVVEDGNVPLARLLPAGSDHRARIVLYRRPLEARAKDGADLADLVHDVLVEQVANYLGLDPDVIDEG